MIDILKQLITQSTAIVLHVLLVMVATLLPFSIASAVGQITQTAVPYIIHEENSSIERSISASTPVEEDITQYWGGTNDVDVIPSVEMEAEEAKVAHDYDNQQ